MNKTFTLIIVCCLLQNICNAQSGILDSSFGSNGVVINDMGSRYNYNNAASQVLIKPDGSMYIICFAPAIIIKRFASGAIDSSYGTNGYSRSISFTNVYAAFQPDGKIVLAGSGYNLNGMARFTNAGVPDSSFGKNGFQTTNFSATAVTVKTNGKIIVTGNTALNSVIGQFNTNGRPDVSFNKTGLALFDFTLKIAPPRGFTDSAIVHTGNATTLAVQADGKIVVAGNVYSELIGKNFAIARYNTDGSMDNSFNGNGRQITAINGTDEGYAVAIQKDGKILLSGYTYTTSSNTIFALVRYNKNGSPDSTFNGNGRQTANAGNMYIMPGTGVGVQTNGKIVLAGCTLMGTDYDFVVARFNENGSPDNSFGTNGIVTTDINTSDDYTGSVTIQSDDKIVLAGYSYLGSNQLFSLARYNRDGVADNNFGVAGKLSGDYNQGNTRYNATAIQADGKVVVAGTTWNGLDNDFAIARYNTNGSVDLSFGDKGKASTSFGGIEEAVAIVIQADGKIIVAGASTNNLNLNQFAVARYNTNGTLDNTFTNNGKQLVSAIGNADICKSVALQADGKIVLAGSTFTDLNYDSCRFALVRLNSNGTPDNTFSDDGKQITSFGDAYSAASSVAIQTDGKIVIAGRIYLNQQNNFAIARYNINGSLDNSFSNDGKQNNVFGAEDYFLESMAIQTDGKIVAAGFSQSMGGSSTSFLLSRYNSNGTPDAAFGNNGFKSTNIGTNFNFGISVAIKNDGRIAVGGTNNNFAIVLYKNNGNPDSSFANNGVQITSIGLSDSRIQCLAFYNNLLYAAGYGQYPGTLGVVARYLIAEPNTVATKIVFFKASLQNNRTVLLQWQTVKANDITGFDVQRSSDGITFFNIGYQAASNGNKPKIDYATIDRQPLNGINYYRLKIAGTDGKVGFTRIISVVVNFNSYSFKLSPNPAKNFLLITVTNSNEKAVFKLINTAGTTIKELSVSAKNTGSFIIDINGLPSGLYYVRMVTKNEVENKVFIKE